MKKIIFSLALLAATATVTQIFAQQTNSRWWVGGSVGFSSNEMVGRPISNSTVSIEPEVGYNLSDRWGIGIRLAVGAANDKSQHDDYSYESDNRIFSIATFARYNYFRWRGVTLFADGGFVYSTYDSESRGGNGYSNSERRYGGLFIDPGVSLRITRHLELVARTNIFTAGYANYNSTPSSSYGTERSRSWNASLNSPLDFEDFFGGFTLGGTITF